MATKPENQPTIKSLRTTRLAVEMLSAAVRSGTTSPEQQALYQRVAADLAAALEPLGGQVLADGVVMAWGECRSERGA